MFRTRDFYLKKVYSVKGKKIGVIEDLYIDFYLGKILGFKVSNKSLFSKNNYVSINNIIENGEDLIINNIENEDGLRFKEIKDMDIVDNSNNLKGVLEDIIIDEEDYYIKGIVMTSGFLDKIIKGKQIILISQCTLGEKYILYNGNDDVLFKSMPHNMEKKNAAREI